MLPLDCTQRLKSKALRAISAAFQNLGGQGQARAVMLYVRIVKQRFCLFALEFSSLYKVRTGALCRQ